MSVRDTIPSISLGSSPMGCPRMDRLTSIQYEGCHKYAQVETSKPCHLRRPHYISHVLPRHLDIVLYGAFTHQI